MRLPVAAPPEVPVGRWAPRTVCAFLSVQVTKTISSSLVDNTEITPMVIFAGLVGRSCGTC